MSEEAFELLICTLINDLSLSFPSDEFPATANSVGQLRTAYEREMRTKMVYKQLGIQRPREQEGVPFPYPDMRQSVGDTTRA